jgi:hypothetical protein
MHHAVWLWFVFIVSNAAIVNKKRIIKDLEFVQRLFCTSGLHILNTGIEKTYCDIILLDLILQYTDISIILHTPNYWYNLWKV